MTPRFRQAYKTKCCCDLADAVEVQTGTQCKVGRGKHDGLHHKPLGLGEWGIGELRVISSGGWPVGGNGV